MIEAAPEVQEMHDFGIHEIEGAALRAFYRFLLEVDESQHWCGLHKTLTNDGNIFWLCDEHREEKILAHQKRPSPPHTGINAHASNSAP